MSHQPDWGKIITQEESTIDQNVTAFNRVMRALKNIGRKRENENLLDFLKPGRKSRKYQEKGNTKLSDHYKKLLEKNPQNEELRVAYHDALDRGE